MPIHEDLLVADFNQCFQQVRDYDERFRKTFEFGFGGLVTVVTACAALVAKAGLSPITLGAVFAICVVASAASFLFSATLARTRVYFVFTCRFLNEVRGEYLKSNPAGVTNKTGMYTDHTKPDVFNLSSSHSAQVIVFAICISVLPACGAVAASGLYELNQGLTPTVNWAAAWISFAISALAQLIAIAMYWKGKEKKPTASTAILQRR